MKKKINKRQKHNAKSDLDKQFPMSGCFYTPTENAALVFSEKWGISETETRMLTTCTFPL